MAGQALEEEKRVEQELEPTVGSEGYMNGKRCSAPDQDDVRDAVEHRSFCLWSAVLPIEFASTEAQVLGDEI